MMDGIILAALALLSVPVLLIVSTRQIRRVLRVFPS